MNEILAQSTLRQPPEHNRHDDDDSVPVRGHRSMTSARSAKTRTIYLNIDGREDQVLRIVYRCSVRSCRLKSSLKFANCTPNVKFV